MEEEGRMITLKRWILLWLDKDDDNTKELRVLFADWCLTSNEEDFKFLVDAALNYRRKP